MRDGGAGQVSTKTSNIAAKSRIKTHTETYKMQISQKEYVLNSDSTPESEASFTYGFLNLIVIIFQHAINQSSVNLNVYYTRIEIIYY